MGEAISLHNAGRDGDTEATAKAVSLLEEIVKSDPTNAKAMAYLGSSYAITARDSESVVDKVRYSNRRLQFLDQAVNMLPDGFVIRILRASVASSLPAIFGRKETAIEDGLILDKMFTATKSPRMAPHMVGIYEMLNRIAEEQGDWVSKADLARKLAEKQ